MKSIQEIKKQRSKQLHELAENLKQQFIAENIGVTAEVLWEGQTETLDEQTTRYFGYTANYLRVACDVPNGVALENRIMPCQLITAETGFVMTKCGLEAA